MILKNFKIYILALSAIFNIFVFSTPVLAQGMSTDILNQLQHASQDKGAGFGAANDPRDVVVHIVQMALGFLGIIFVCLVIYAGYLWMTAGGNEEDVSKAKTLLYQSVIGLAIILSAYSISKAIVSLLLGRPLNYDNGVYVTQDPVYFKGPGDY